MTASALLLIAAPHLGLIILCAWGYLILPACIIRLLYVWWRLLIAGPTRG